MKNTNVTAIVGPTTSVNVPASTTISSRTRNRRCELTLTCDFMLKFAGYEWFLKHHAVKIITKLCFSNSQKFLQNVYPEMHSI